MVSTIKREGSAIYKWTDAQGVLYGLGKLVASTVLVKGFKSVAFTPAVECLADPLMLT